MAPAFAFASILGGLTTLMAAWPRFGATSLLLAPLGGSATVLALGALTALRRPAAEVAATDEMVSRLRGALNAADHDPPRAPAAPEERRRARG